MTGTFWDTIVVCTITGLAIASSGVLGMTDAAGNMLTGSDVTIAAFETVLGSAGAWLVTIGLHCLRFLQYSAGSITGKKHLNICWERTGLIWYTALFFPLLCISDVHRH